MVEKSDESRILRELHNLHERLDDAKTSREKEMILNQINSLKKILKEKNKNSFNLKNAFAKPLPQVDKGVIKFNNKVADEKLPSQKNSTKVAKSFNLSSFEKKTLQRLKQSEEGGQKKSSGEKEASNYVNFSSRYFGDYSNKLITKNYFQSVIKNLPKTQMRFIPKTYVSVILFTSFISIFVGLFLFVFFMIFNIGATIPFITLAGGNILTRFFQTFWIPILIPLSTFAFMYFYPSLERKSLENRINQELPFATIHMSAISGSMVEPSKIFSIIISTHEYPYLEKEFIKLLNEMNILGYDLVTALRNSSINSPSKRLAELFNGLATTINSGGDLPNFFEKRSETLLFDYRIEREKKTRSAETFMDIYISVVIAAPMILMLLLMMMKISGLGISLSAGMITLIMGLGVTGINIAFLTFLHLKGAGE